MNSGLMRAALLRKPSSIDENPLKIEEIKIPSPQKGQALLRVLACGVCHTDLHIAEGELQQRQSAIIPGHQIVAEVVESPTPGFAPGMRVGVSWVGGTDGTCPYCLIGRENLCDHPTFTGYTQNGGFAEYTVARTDFLLPIPSMLSDTEAAPLLCAGIIGYRSIRVAEVNHGQSVGLFGFGSSAQLIIQVLHSWNCRVFVSTREEAHQNLAKKLGAHWVGDATTVPPEPLDCAVTFAPVGEVVIAALRSLRKGGIVAINAIHLDRIPEFDYDSLLWGERQIRSVANMTRQDGREFLKIAEKIHLKPEVDLYPLDQANQALQAIRHDKFSRPAVILPSAR